MSNQEILNILSTLESEFYYRIDEYKRDDSLTLDDYEEMHQLIDSALVRWHRITGLKITE